MYFVVFEHFHSPSFFTTPKPLNAPPPDNCPWPPPRSADNPCPRSAASEALRTCICCSATVNCWTISRLVCARCTCDLRLYFRPNIMPQISQLKGFNLRWTLLKCRLRFWAREEPRNTLLHTWHETCSMGRRREPETNTVLQF